MSEPKPEFVPFPLFIFSRDSMTMTEVKVIKVTEARYYIDRSVPVARGDRGGGVWLHMGLSPDGCVFDSGPSNLKNERWLIAFGRDREKLLAEIRTRQADEIARCELKLKQDKMWLAGFKASFP